MGILAPALLAAGLAVAIPIWLHLTRRPPDRRQVFPSLAFLEEASLQATRRRALRDPLLLALRVAAIALVVAAFARPYLREDPAAAAARSGIREVVLLLDRSYSMGADGRMDAAKAAAREVIAQLGEGDRLTLAAFDDAARALGPATRDPQTLGALLDSVAAGEGGTAYAPALRLAESILAASPGPRRELVLISDFASGRAARDAAVSLPPGTTLRAFPVETEGVDDLAVSEVTLRRAGFAAGERVRVLARVRNAGDVAVRGRAVALTLDGARVAGDTVSVEPGQSVTVEFPPFSVASGAAVGEVRVAGDDLAVNDARHFVAEPRRSLDVLIVEPDGTGPRTGLHLRRALELGRSPTFVMRRRTPRSLGAEDFAAAAVVVLDGVPFPEGETGRALRAFVEAGGGLVWGAGARSGGSIPEEAAGLLPAGAHRTVSRPEGASLARIAYGHPVFAPFRDPGSGDLGGARVDRYRSVDGDGMRVLARYDDGAPALLEAEMGLGRSLAWTSTLGDAWGDLPIQPVYLPLVHRLVLHAAGWDEGATGQVVGATVEPADLIAVGAHRDEPAMLVAPGGTRRPLDASSGPLVLDRSGIWEVRDPGAAEVRRFAVNVDADEAGMNPVDTAGLAVAAPASGVDASRASSTGMHPVPAAPDDGVPATEREPGRPLWWPLLLAAGVAFLLEGVLSNVRPGRRVIGGTR